jgi:cytochrome d ubiquinol oxidase subunit II
VSKAEAVAALLWVAVTLYAVFGGADFGAGAWSLLAGRGERSERVRGRIDRSLAPVWEANHVWLIFALVVLWTSFPEAFSAVMTTLYVPLALAALGIVLRGSGFAFRKAISGRGRRAAERVFSLSSVLTPFFMGTVVGAVASGEVPAEGGGDPIESWTGAVPLLIGLMFVATGAYLAAVFLVWDSRSAGEEENERHFSRCAIAAGLLAGAVALGGLLLFREDARFVYDGLTGPALPLVVASALCGLAVLAMLGLGVRRGMRPLAVFAVVAVVWGWAVAQHPYLLPETRTIEQGAGADASLTAILVVFGAAMLVVLPALGLLYVLSQRRVLEDG